MAARRAKAPKTPRKRTVADDVMSESRKLGDVIASAKRRNARTGRGGTRALGRDEAGESDRLHGDYWGRATDSSINAEIAQYLVTWRNRCRYEARNNPTIKGMMRTYCNDVVGAKGPKLDLRTKYPVFNEKAEELWESWWKRPDINGRISGVELLKIYGNQLWTHGAYLGQIVPPSSGIIPDQIQTRIRVIDARRLATPFGLGSANDVFLGIKVTEWGEPVSYFIQQPDFRNQYQYADPVEIPAKYMIHGFELIEPEQLTGIPWMKWMLVGEADRRQYDRHVMAAAQNAASWAGYLKSTTADAVPIEAASSIDVEPATLTTLPPGWDLATLAATQPSTQYEAYMRIQLAKTGRCIDMPYGTVALDYQNLSFSSARLMMNTYYGGLESDREQFVRIVLDRLFFTILEEAELKGILSVPDDPIRTQWTWPNHPSVDPGKDAQAATERLANLTSTHELEAARDGIDFGDLLESHRKTKEQFAGIGITVPVTKQGAAGNTPQNDTGSDTDNPPPSNGMGSNGHGRLNGLAATGRYHG